MFMVLYLKASKPYIYGVVSEGINACMVLYLNEGIKDVIKTFCIDLQAMTFSFVLEAITRYN